MSDNEVSVKLNTVVIERTVMTASARITLHSHDLSTKDLVKEAKQLYREVE